MWLKSENKASNNANLAKLNLEKSSGTDVEACFNLKNIKISAKKHKIIYCHQYF